MFAGVATFPLRPVNRRAAVNGSPRRTRIPPGADSVRPALTPVPSRCASPAQRVAQAAVRNVSAPVALPNSEAAA